MSDNPRKDEWPWWSSVFAYMQCVTALACVSNVTIAYWR